MRQLASGAFEEMRGIVASLTDGGGDALVLGVLSLSHLLFHTRLIGFEGLASFVLFAQVLMLSYVFAIAAIVLGGIACVGVWRRGKSVERRRVLSRAGAGLALGLIRLIL